MEEYPVTKRDKRRYNMSRRLQQLNESFSTERDVHYADMLHSLQLSLYALHMGNNPEFLESLADVEEERDLRLTELYLWEHYQTEQAELQHKHDMAAATTEYEQMLQLVKEKLRTRLETQRKRLTEDRALLDIANDHSFFLSAASPTDPTRSSQLSAADRRSLRRRDLNEEPSGVSASEARTRRNRAQASDVETGSDRELDAVFKEIENPQSRHITKSYQGVNVLKPEESLSDLSMIRESSKRLRRR